MFKFSLPDPNHDRIARWYFGGVTATMAQIVVHPLDVVKVGVQLRHPTDGISIRRYIKYIMRIRGR